MCVSNIYDQTSRKYKISKVGLQKGSNKTRTIQIVSITDNQYQYHCVQLTMKCQNGCRDAALPLNLNTSYMWQIYVI